MGLLRWVRGMSEPDDTREEGVEARPSPLAALGINLKTVASWLGAAAVVGAIAVSLGPAEDEAGACDDVTSYLDRTWDGAGRGRVRAAGADEETVEALGAFAATWNRERREVCHAAEASTTDATRWSTRRRCLERWAEGFASGLTWVEDEGLEPSRLASVLLSPSRCRSAGTLAPLPADPERMARVLAGRRYLVRGQLRIGLGQDDEAKRDLSQAAAAFREAGHVALEVEAEGWRLALEPVSDVDLLELAERAAAAGEDRTTARVLARLVWGRARAGVARDAELEAWARATIERVDDRVARGWWALAQGDPKAAAWEFERGLGPGHAFVLELAAPR